MRKIKLLFLICFLNFFLFSFQNVKEKKMVKEQEIPSGHNSEDYIVERLECPSHDGRLVPLTITRHKKTKIDGSATLLLYGYGSYGISCSFTIFFSFVFKLYKYVFPGVFGDE